MHFYHSHFLSFIVSMIVLFTAPIIVKAQDHTTVDATPSESKTMPITTQLNSDDPQPENNQEEGNTETHKGFFFRTTLGLGWGWLIGNGTMSPAPGLRRIDDPHHSSPTFNFALDAGGGFKGLSIHMGTYYERLILRSDTPTEAGFSLFGLTMGATYYFTESDFYISTVFRLMGLLVFLPNVDCENFYADKYDWYKGRKPSVRMQNRKKVEKNFY